MQSIAELGGDTTYHTILMNDREVQAEDIIADAEIRVIPKPCLTVECQGKQNGSSWLMRKKWVH
jgi:hypothetical protein